MLYSLCMLHLMFVCWASIHNMGDNSTSVFHVQDATSEHFTSVKVITTVMREYISMTAVSGASWCLVSGRTTSNLRYIIVYAVLQ